MLQHSCLMAGQAVSVNAAAYSCWWTCLTPLAVFMSQQVQVGQGMQQSSCRDCSTVCPAAQPVCLGPHWRPLHMATCCFKGPSCCLMAARAC